MCSSDLKKIRKSNKKINKMDSVTESDTDLSDSNNDLDGGKKKMKRQNETYHQDVLELIKKIDKENNIIFENYKKIRKIYSQKNLED